MNKYEGIIIFKPDLSDEERNADFDRIQEVIKQNGSVSEVDEWGKRKLAYEINYITEGYYVLVNFEADPAHISEVERRCRLTDSVIRYMFVNKDKK